MPRLPLEGIRVVDLTAVWAGPYATRVLGDMGAEIIKVEGSQNPDMLRSLAFLAEPDPRSYNKSAYFNHNNRSKLACSISLTHPEGRELLLELVKVSDVLIENFRADVMDRFGLGYEAVKAAKPDIVYVSMPGHGKTGPESHHVAYGTNVEQLAGLVSISGYVDDEPHKSGISYGDPTAGTLAAGAVVTALLHRKRTGKGQYVEIAQRESLTNLIGEFVVGYSMNHRMPGRIGNRHAWMAPHGCYPTSGDDEWVTIACRNDLDFAALAEAMGEPDLIDDSRYATVASRHANQDSLDETIAAWTAPQDKFAVTELLQASGIPSAPVLLHTELLRDPHLAARGFFERPRHPEAGEWPMEGPLFHFRASQPHLQRNAPCFAEHNDYVFRDLLGLDDARIAALTEAGVIATEPNMATHM
jgi:crotonobetainyl-CoA:carnitine CoA-transferase CaiB-like acyl-CoA transferase